MAILGQNYRQRRRPMGPLILVALVVLIVAFLAFAYSRGGEVPTERVEKTIAMPGAAASDAGTAQPEG